MSRKSTLAIMLVLFALFVVAFAVNKPQSALAQTPKPAPILGKTFLEGMALDEEGEPLYKVHDNNTSKLGISIKNRDGEEVWRGSFPGDLGGLYRIELKPGAYDLFISRPNGYGVVLRPMRINGILLKGGKINKLDITMHKGELLETIGEPVEPTLPAIIISEEFAKLHKEIDDLKKIIEELKKK